MLKLIKSTASAGGGRKGGEGGVAISGFLVVFWSNLL